MVNWRHSLYFVLLRINIPTEAQWNVSLRSSPLLPEGTWSQAVGYYDGNIHLIGGGTAEFDKSWAEYVVASNTFIDKGSDVLPYTSSGHSQHYTQIDDKLYWIEGDKTIYSYDFFWESFTIEGYASYLTADYACLTSYQDLLFVLGGFYLTPQRLVQVLNTSSLSWITPVDQMITTRRDLACATDTSRGEVYAIGGHTGGGWTTNIEKLSVKYTNISQAVWQTGSYLSYADWGLRAVYIASVDSVLIIGKDVSRIDCKTGQVGHLTDLHYISRNAGVIYVDNVLYVLGGYDAISTWQHITNPLLLKAPTKETTAEPETETTVYLETETNGPTNAQTADKSLDNTGSRNNAVVYIIIAIVAVLLLILCGFMVYYGHHKKKTIIEDTLQISIEEGQGQHDHDGPNLTTTAIAVNIQEEEEVPAVVVFNEDNAEEDEGDDVNDAVIGEEDGTDDEKSGSLPVLEDDVTSKHAMEVVQNEDIEYKDAKKEDSDSDDHDSMYDSMYDDNPEKKEKHRETFEVTSGDEGEGEVLSDNDFRQWDPDHVLKWILLIENGILVEYEEDLRKEIFSRNVCGEDMMSFDIDDIKALGVTKFAHAKLLQNAIVELIKESHNENVNHMSNI